MSALAWWLIPIGATILAVAFVMLRSRPERPTSTEDSVERLRRMQEAMERPMPHQQPTRPDAAGSPDAAGGTGPEPS